MKHDTKIKGEPGPITIAISGYDAGRVEQRVAELLRDHACETMKEAIDHHVALAVQEAVMQVTEETIRPTVERVLKEGWQPTNEWGHPRGAKVTLEQRVGAIVIGDDRYDSMLNRMTKDIVERELKGDLSKVMAAAAARFRAVVDKTLGEKLSAAMRDAAGLKP
jgi:hypothetical protein